jgi:hypothetical protein
MGRSCGIDSKFCTVFLEIATRVMHGLLAYDGNARLSIKTLDPFACLESCSVICELFTIFLKPRYLRTGVSSAAPRTPSDPTCAISRAEAPRAQEQARRRRSVLNSRTPWPSACRHTSNCKWRLVRATSTSSFPRDRRFWTGLRSPWRSW